MMVYVAELKLTRILYTISKGESSMNNVSRRRALLSVKGYSTLDFSIYLVMNSRLNKQTKVNIIIELHSCHN